MGSITSGVGLFSGIDSQSLISQLLQIEARPRVLMEQRMKQLQLQQAGYLDINSRLNALKTAAMTFRTAKTFLSMRAASSNTEVLTATAGTTAQPGSYTFVVDRLVTTQQLLSRGFADKDISGLGATSFTFESADGRLDRDTSLASLNGGEGIARGKFVITQGSASATVDLSKAVTMSDVIQAISTAAGVDVDAKVEDGRLVVTGSSAFTISNATGYTTATSLGIAGSSGDVSGTQVLSGSMIYYAGQNTSLGHLNDGNGVFISDTVGETRHDFVIRIAGTTPTDVKVNIGPVYDSALKKLQGAATTLGGVVQRINDALAAAGVSGVAASIAPDGSRLRITNSTGENLSITEVGSGTTARDLGIAIATPTAAASVDGRRVLAGLNDTLASTLDGGSGIGGDGMLNLTARDGTAFSVDLSSAETVQDILDAINGHASNGGKIVATLNSAGHGFTITDATGAVASNLIITGDAADSLNISTGDSGVATAVVKGGSAQHAYITHATAVSKLAGGAGIGEGRFRVTDGNGRSAIMDIGKDVTNVGQLLREINGQFSANSMNVEAVINEKGDGILVREKDSEDDGASVITIEDESGAVAKRLGIAGEASGTGDENFIDGSAEVTVEFAATDTLADVVSKINEASPGVSASIINDGTGSNPFRVSIVSRSSGRAGRMIVDTGSFDLGLSTLQAGEDSRVFFGSTDPAQAILLSGSSNTLDSVITGVKIDLQATSAEPIELTVSRDTAAIETAIDAFVTAFNGVIERIDFQSRYNSETKEKGPLLGDGASQALRRTLFARIQGDAQNISGAFQNLADVGLKFESGGKIAIDKDRLREAMEEDFQAVADVFAARVVADKEEFEEIEPGIKVRKVNPQSEFTSLGLMGIMEELAQDYLDTVDGILTTRSKSLQSQVELIQKRISEFNVRLEGRREVLSRQFLAMEQAVAQLQSQSSALSSLSRR